MTSVDCPSLNSFHASANMQERHLQMCQVWKCPKIVTPGFGLIVCVYVLSLCFHCVQVRKEYGKCLRTHCCSGKSVESSIGSGKGTASRAPGRYSTGSQVASQFSYSSFICFSLFCLYRLTINDELTTMQFWIATELYLKIKYVHAVQ